MKNIAIFASGSGSNFQAIVDAVEFGKIHSAQISLLVCDQPQAKVIERAKKYHIPTFVFSAKDYASKQDYETEIRDLLLDLQIDLIVLAGYMKLIGKTLLDRFEGKIINIHPTLLPLFPGKDGILQSYQSAEKQLGITVHYVDSGMDTGKIIAQKSFERIGNETLEEIETRIHQLEHELYPQVIAEWINFGSKINFIIVEQNIKKPLAAASRRKG